MDQEKTSTIAIGSTELTYDIRAAYNDRYKTLEEASQAVRSALTGEIEPIRNAGISLTVASMQEYLDSLGIPYAAEGANVRTAVLAFAPKCKYNRGIETR